MRFDKSELWHTELLSKYAKKITLKNKNNLIENIICNSAQNGLIQQKDFFDRTIVNNENTENYYVIEQGDFVYNPRKSVTAPYGPVNVYEYTNSGIVSPLYLCFKVDGIDKRFLNYYFKSSAWYKYIYENGDSGARHDRVSIKDDVFLAQPIIVPHLTTQDKIASFLSKIDQRIETQSKIIEDLNIEKKIISDKIFSQTPLRKDLLCSFYNKGKAGGTPKSTNKKYYDGDVPFLSISDMTEQGKYLYTTQRTLTQEGLANSTAWIVPGNSLILSMYASVGQVAINKIPLATSQAMFSMTLKDNSNLDFLYYYLSYFRENKLHKYLETGTQSNINADFVKGIEIPYYGENKNKQIVSLLSLIDERIQKEKDILSLYKKQKAYLLANMFI